LSVNLSVLRLLRRAAARAERAGFSWVSQFGRTLIGSLPFNISVQTDSITLYGFGEHWSYLHALQTGALEDFRAQLFRNSVRPGSVVLDLGAYIGRFSLLAAQQAGPTGIVYAFEPDPRNFKALVKNVMKNGFAGHVIPIRKAAFDREAEHAFHVAEGPHCGSSLFAAESIRTTVTKCVSIDKFLPSSLVVEVVKLDVEGAEIHALRGMKRTLTRSMPNLTVLVECNPPKLNAAGGSSSKLLTMLRDLGLAVSVVDEEVKKLRPLRSDREIETLKGFLLCRGKETF
jgi:FkbM family methyltransferase